MSKTSFVHRVPIVIPLIGISLKNYGNIYLSTISNQECSMKIFYKLINCAKTSENKYIKPDQKNVNSYIISYVNRALIELLDMCLDGEITIECSVNVPDITIFVIGTTEIFLNLFKLRKIEYKDVQHIFAALDKNFWSIENPYIFSLRCAYLNKATCICKDVYDIVKFDAIDVSIELIDEFKCRKNLCLELDNPFDNITTFYMIKFATHVVSKVAQDLNSSRSLFKSVERYLKLLYDIEMRIVLENIENNEASILTSSNVLIKPIPDISSIKLYKLNIKYLSEV